MKRKVRLPNPMAVLAWIVFLLPGRWLSDRADAPLAVVAALVGLATLWSMPAPWESRGPARRAAVLLGALQVLYAFSFAYALAFKGAQTGAADFVELPRWLLVGVFLVYVIRHHEPSVKAATERALTASAYAGFLLFDRPADVAYAAVLALGWLALYSRSRWRLLHAAAAAATAAWAFSAARFTRVFPSEVLRMIRLSPVLGWGPGRCEPALSSGSQYALWVARGGVIGSGLIAGGLALVVSRLLADEEDLRRRAAFALLLAATAALLLTGPVLDSYRMVFWTTLVLAAVHEHRGSAA
jgi:hypothetical protein